LVKDCNLAADLEANRAHSRALCGHHAHGPGIAIQRFQYPMCPPMDSAAICTPLRLHARGLVKSRFNFRGEKL